jgi:hypothetical protein
MSGVVVTHASGRQTGPSIETRKLAGPLGPRSKSAPAYGRFCASMSCRRNSNWGLADRPYEIRSVPTDAPCSYQPPKRGKG